MDIPVLAQLVVLIETLFKSHGPEVIKAAEQAAAGAAISTAETDPKIQAMTAASVALLQAAQNLKTEIDKPVA